MSAAIFLSLWLWHWGFQVPAFAKNAAQPFFSYFVPELDNLLSFIIIISSTSLVLFQLTESNLIVVNSSKLRFFGKFMLK
jgi:hypothetical protein